VRFHAAASVFPLLEGDDFESLSADIGRNGLREAIWLHPDGSIIDGRNRYRACRKAGVTPRFRTWNGRGSLTEFVISLNLARRHLTISQRACLAVLLLPMLEREARKRMAAGGGDKRSALAAGSGPQIFAGAVGSGDAGESRDKAARIAHVNRQYVSDAKRLAANEPVIFADVLAGRKTIQEAKSEIHFRLRRGLVDPDAVRPIPEVPCSRLGDLWLCGDHRVVCGDATDPKAVGLLLEDRSPFLLVVDAPYGVSLDNEWRTKAGLNGSGPRTKGHTQSIVGDTQSDWSKAYELVPSLEVAYVFHAGTQAVTVGQGLERIGFDIRQQLVWVKDVAVFSRQPYHWRHEPIYFAVKRGAVYGLSAQPDARGSSRSAYEAQGRGRRAVGRRRGI
jgi:hypothetical protein